MKGNAPVREYRRVKARRGAVAGQPAGTLEDIRRILGVQAKPVAEVLPEAITEAADRRRPALNAALEGTVTDTIRVVASRNPDLFGEILSPTIGVAVRKAVSAAIAALMQRFNEALERSLSVRSVKWRLEARRTGRPFAEVVLVHTLVYRVEQVFLIHSTTGLVLQHVVAEGAPSADPDQVASMLSAIDSFSREAFEPKPAGVYLHEFALGDLTVWIDRDPTIAVAVVVRGVAPRTLLELIRATRERVYFAHRDDLATFVSDIEPFARARPILESCLREQHTEAPKRGPVVLAALALLVATALALFFVSSRNRHSAGEHQLDAYRRALIAEPGIVVTDAERVDGGYRIAGFRDPLAAEPARIIALHGYPRAEVRFAPFYSLDPRIVEKRAHQALQPPPEVDLSVQHASLRMSGKAPRAWIERALLVAAAMPGIERVETRDLTASEALAEYRSASRALEAADLRFGVGSNRLPTASRRAIGDAADLIQRLSGLSSDLHLDTCIGVIGDTDETGSAQRNAWLASERARNVVTALRSRLPDTADDMLRAQSRPVADARPRARSVHFQVEARSGGTGAGCGGKGQRVR